MNSATLQDGTIIRVGDIVRAPGESGHVARCVVLWFENRTTVVLTRSKELGFQPTKYWFGTPVRKIKDIRK